jgi:WD40 repeat protein/serine/threonine protein kinase
MSASPASRPSADRNLLLGILALQMDFVSRDALITAMNAWVLDKSKSVGDILVSQQALAPKRLALLESLVEEHLEQHGRDPEKSLAAVGSVDITRVKLEQIADPEVKARLSGVFGGPALLPLSPSEGHGDNIPTEGTVLYQPARPSGMRFLVVRPHAQGALGEVFVALDVELNREVALKKMKAGSAEDAAHRARFVQEAEITGKLEHPGIVPVYGYGEYADCRPYYAMRFIKGESLNEAIRRFHQTRHADEGQRSLALRKLLGAFLAVCQAIDYAHSRGILHRDLKPSNIMLGKFGETLVVDWGLAKSLDQPETQAADTEHELAERPLRRASGSGSVETILGSAVGTPNYMSPEQAAGRGDLVGPGSDVYGLGATLYALLTGKLPFDGSDEAEVLQRVQRGAFPRPRSIASRIPAALEAICLKAMALRPKQRYASARELAEDLEHWLADEPVTAYPEPAGARLARWGRHHKPLVTGAAALLLTAVTALSLGLVLLGQANTQIQEQRNQAEQQRQQAVSHLYQSLVGEARALRQARGEGYRAKAWKLLHQALQLDTPEKDVGQLRQEAVACMGDYAGLEPTIWKGWEGDIHLLALQPQGVELALGLADGSVLLRSLDTGAEIARLRHPGAGISAVHFGPDGRSLVTGDSRGTITVWQITATGQWTSNRTLTVDHSADSVTSVGITPDGKHLAACTANGTTISVWNLADGAREAPFRGPRGERPVCLAFSPQANLLAAGCSHPGWNGILVWDVATRQLKPIVLHSLHHVAEVVFSHDGRYLAATCGDSGIVVYDTATFQRRLFVAGYVPLGVAFSPDSQLLAIPSIQFGVVRLWNVTMNREVAVLSHPGEPRWVAFRSDGRALVTAQPRSVRIWNLVGDEEKRVLSGHEEGVPGLAFSPDGKLLASAGKDMTAAIWDPATGQLLHRLTGFGGVLHTVAFSRDGRLLATGDRAGKIRIWEVGTWQELAAPTHEIGFQIWSVAFSPDGRYFAACGLPGGAVLWRMEFRPAREGQKALLTLEKVARLSDRETMFVCFSPDSDLVVWCIDSTAYLWELKKSRPLPSLPAQLVSPMLSLAFRPEGKRAVLLGPTLTPEVWDAASGHKLFSLPGEEFHGGRPATIASVIALSADGAWLAQQGTSVKVWDLERRKLLLVLPEEHSTPWCLTWSPNKELLAVGSEHGGIALWNLPKIKEQLTRIGLGW